MVEAEQALLDRQEERAASNSCWRRSFAACTAWLRPGAEPRVATLLRSVARR
jgi:hypothetical protein